MSAAGLRVELVTQQGLSHGLRRTLLRSARHLEQHGPPRWQRADAQCMDELLAIWFELHAARWAACSQAGVRADPSVRAFHRAAAGGLLARGLLEQEVLWLRQRPVAASYTLRGRCAATCTSAAMTRRCRA